MMTERCLAVSEHSPATYFCCCSIYIFFKKALKKHAVHWLSPHDFIPCNSLDLSYFPFHPFRTLHSRTPGDFQFEILGIQVWIVKFKPPPGLAIITNENYGLSFCLSRPHRITTGRDGRRGRAGNNINTPTI